jgi:shikimate 5-dehydrogenase
VHVSASVPTAVSEPVSEPALALHLGAALFAARPVVLDCLYFPRVTPLLAHAAAAMAAHSATPSGSSSAPSTASAVSVATSATTESEPAAASQSSHLLVSGRAMFVHQGVAQFERWTNRGRVPLAAATRMELAAAARAHFRERDAAMEAAAAAKAAAAKSASSLPV